MGRTAHFQHPVRAVFIAAGLLATSAVAGTGLPEPLTPFEADYRVGNGTVRVGSATFRLARTTRTWRYQSTLRVEGVFALFVEGPLRETTWLEPHEGGLRPIAYRHERGNESLRIIFDWGSGHASVADDGEARRIALEPNARDQSSAILAVMAALAAGERSLTLQGIDDDGETEPLRFEVTGQERIEVPLGSYDTVRVRRMHESDRVTVTWLAPALGWIPVRVEQREDGELNALLELTALNSR